MLRDSLAPDYNAGSRAGNDIVKYIIDNIIDKRNLLGQLLARFEFPSLFSKWSEREPSSAMTKDIRVGLIGAGFIGQMHSLSLGDVSRARREPIFRVNLVALAERNPILAGAMMEHYGWREIVTAWRSLATCADIDLLVNAGPNQSSVTH
jgi:hypothetical protein